MIAYRKSLWEKVATSLWFVPGLLALGAVLLVWLTATISNTMMARRNLARWLHSGSAEEARELLSVLVPAMISMTTLVVSITMVVLTLAAAQLGPRLIRNFMANTRTQLMLGFFLATVIYLVLVLLLVINGAREDGVPHLAVTTGAGLVLICIFLLLFFVHHLARSIVSDTTIQRVGLVLDSAIDEMLPDADAARSSPEDPPPLREGGAVLRLQKGGYVQEVNYSGLVDCAHKAGAVIDLHFRPGQHLLPDAEHGRLHPASALNDDVWQEISDCIVMGGQRTATQDLEYAVRQLVEVALRALSPGINDPFTAIAAIDRLALSIALIMGRGSADSAWCDADGTVRVTGRVTSFRGIVDTAFNQIRQSGEQPAILIQLVGTLGTLADHVRHEEHRRVLVDHVELILDTGRRAIPESYDLETLEERGKAALDRLNQRQGAQAR